MPLFRYRTVMHHPLCRHGLTPRPCFMARLCHMLCCDMAVLHQQSSSAEVSQANDSCAALMVPRCLPTCLPCPVLALCPAMPRAALMHSHAPIGAGLQVCCLWPCSLPSRCTVPALTAGQYKHTWIEVPRCLGAVCTLTMVPVCSSVWGSTKT
jgi:hypothetical protein